MNMNETIARINELFHKQKSVGLTAEEKEEQAILRRKYIDSIKANVRANMENVRIQNEDGSITTFEKQ